MNICTAFAIIDIGGSMKITSDCGILTDGFEWAVKKIGQFVVTGTENGDINRGDGGKWYGPDGKVIKYPTAEWAQPKNYKAAFWAGYFDRTAYYIRDFVHQAAGAHFAGLDEELYEMFYTFVSNADESTGWYAPWAFNFDHSIYYMDTPNKKRFVREITAQFELVELCLQLYLRTGDRRYIDDNKIRLFCDKIMTDFISSQDGTVLAEKNGIPEGKGDIWQGSATYNERGFHAAEAGDSIAAMYRALCCYQKILELRGECVNAQRQGERAKQLRDYFNNEWSVVDGSDMYCYAIDKRGKKHYKWHKKGSEIYGGASLIFIPLKSITYAGERNSRLLDYIFAVENDEKTREDNIESLTYLPEVFFNFHQNNRAWYWMKYILSKKDLPHEHKSQGTNGDYPEISFTFISQTVEGLMGIKTDAENGRVSSCPRFPDDINVICAQDILFGNRCVDVEMSDVSCTLTDKSDEPVEWRCCFEGEYEYLTVNGIRTQAKHINDNGTVLSYADAVINPCETAVITTK